MKTIAKEFEELFKTQGYKVKSVRVFKNADGEGHNMISVNAGVRVLSKIARDLSKIGFFDIRVEEEFDWGTVDFEDPKSEPKKVYTLKAFV